MYELEKPEHISFSHRRHDEICVFTFRNYKELIKNSSVSLFISFKKHDLTTETRKTIHSKCICFPCINKILHCYFSSVKSATVNNSQENLNISFIFT